MTAGKLGPHSTHRTMGRRAHRTEVGKHFNEGARLLWAFVMAHDEGQRGVARDLDVDVTALNRWLYGERKPSRESASVVQQKLGIDAGAWDAEPSIKFTLPGVAANDVVQKAG